MSYVTSWQVGYSRSALASGFSPVGVQWAVLLVTQHEDMYRVHEDDYISPQQFGGFCRVGEWSAHGKLGIREAP